MKIMKFIEFQVLVESLLVGDPRHIGADMSKLEISGELQGRKLKLASAPSPELKLTNHLPRLFREAQKMDSLAHFTEDEFVAAVLATSPSSLVVQRLEVLPCIGTLEIVAISQACDERIKVARGKAPVVFPIREVKTKKTDHVDLFRDVATSSPAASSVKPTSADTTLEDDTSFSSLSNLLQDMLGCSNDDPLLLQLRGCEKTLLEAEEEASLHKGDAEDVEGDDESQESEAEEQQEQQVETLDDVMSRLGVTFEGGHYYHHLIGASSELASKVRLGKINTIRRSGMDHSLQAACVQNHRKCTLIVDLHRCSTRLQLERLLVEWLAHGFGKSEQQHHAMGVQLRQSLGVKVRT